MCLARAAPDAPWLKGNLGWQTCWKDFWFTVRTRISFLPAPLVARGSQDPPDFLSPQWVTLFQQSPAMILKNDLFGLNIYHIPPIRGLSAFHNNLVHVPSSEMNVSKIFVICRIHRTCWEAWCDAWKVPHWSSSILHSHCILYDLSALRSRSSHNMSGFPIKPDTPPPASALLTTNKVYKNLTHHHQLLFSSQITTLKKIQIKFNGFFAHSEMHSQENTLKNCTQYVSSSTYYVCRDWVLENFSAEQQHWWTFFLGIWKSCWQRISGSLQQTDWK